MWIAERRLGTLVDGIPNPRACKVLRYKEMGYFRNIVALCKVSAHEQEGDGRPATMMFTRHP
jgi:hypothetical protein